MIQLSAHLIPAHSANTLAVNHKLNFSLLLARLNTLGATLNASIAANEEFESGGKLRKLGRLDARARDSH